MAGAVMLESNDASAMRCPRCGAVVHYRTASEAALTLIGTILAMAALVVMGSAILWLLVTIWRAIL